MRKSYEEKNKILKTTMKLCCEEKKFNAETIRAIEDAHNRKGLFKAKTLKELCKKLGI